MHCHIPFLAQPLEMLLLLFPVQRRENSSDSPRITQLVSGRFLHTQLSWSQSPCLHQCAALLNTLDFAKRLKSKLHCCAYKGLQTCGLCSFFPSFSSEFFCFFPCNIIFFLILKIPFIKPQSDKPNLTSLLCNQTETLGAQNLLVTTFVHLFQDLIEQLFQSSLNFFFFFEESFEAEKGFVRLKSQNGESPGMALQLCVQLLGNSVT